MNWLKVVTRLTYPVCLLALVFIPLVVWARSNGIVDLTGIGAFAAGVGVPMGILTGAMAWTRVAAKKGGNGGS